MLKDRIGSMLLVICYKEFKAFSEGTEETERELHLCDFYQISVS